MIQCPDMEIPVNNFQQVKFSFKSRFHYLIEELYISKNMMAFIRGRVGGLDVYIEVDKYFLFLVEEWVDAGGIEEWGRETRRFTKLNSSFNIFVNCHNILLGQYSQASPGLICILANTISSCFALLNKRNISNLNNKI